MIPAHMQSDFDSLNEYQKSKFQELVSWSNAGEPGQFLMSDMAISKLIEQVKRLEAPVVVEAPADEAQEEPAKE